MFLFALVDDAWRDTESKTILFWDPRRHIKMHSPCRSIVTQLNGSVEALDLIQPANSPALAIHTAHQYSMDIGFNMTRACEPCW